MVKFGRHVDFFVGDPARRKLYVVPYKDVQRRTFADLPPPPSSRPQQHLPPPAAPRPLTPSADDGTNAVPPMASTTSTATSGRSGLSALFDDNVDEYDDDADADANADADDDIEGNTTDPSMSVNVRANAVTITAGTGAELAAALRAWSKLSISQRGKKRPSSKGKTMLTPAEKMMMTTTTSSAMVGFDLDGEMTAERLEEDVGVVEDESERDFAIYFVSQRFQTEWRKCLGRASDDFDRAMQTFWREVFESMAEHHVLEPHIGRGALPDAALQSYVACAPPDLAHHTFSLLKDIHATALINAEALRKLVKKFDKKMAPHNDGGNSSGDGNGNGNGNSNSYTYGNGNGNGSSKRGGLSARLLPELYASNFTGSLASLEGGLALLRILLNIDEEEEDAASVATVSTNNRNNNNGKTNGNNYNIDAANPSDDGDGETDEVLLTGSGYFGNRHNKEAVDAELVKGRKEELEWLNAMIGGIDPIYIPHLVAHRGFHSPLDRSDVRPLENSLTAYEAAWTNGLHLCECDIALTKDERIILAHDENFARLGMDPTSPLCNKTVRDLTFKELMNCPIKSGARPPLLFDVLRSAAAIGGDAKMVVEIKAGNMDAGTSLARIFVRHPQLMDHVAIVMSFDAFIMHHFRREMAVVHEHLHSGGGGDFDGGAYHHHPQQQQPNQPIAHRRETSTTAPNRISPHDVESGGGLDNNPLLLPKAPVHRSRSNTLGSSPHLGQTKLLHSTGRLPSMLGGGHKRIDSQDLFGLGASVGGGWNTSADNNGGSQFGLNLADLDAPVLSSSPTATFLPNIRRSMDNLHHQQKSPENRESPHPSPVATEAAAAAKDGGFAIKSFPKILLLTVDDTREPDDHHQFVDFTKPDKVAKLLRGGDGGSLDGVYMQFQKEMITPKGSKAMRNLAAMYHVGVWGTTPDDWDTFHTLVNECHVSYVNTDLPRHFRRKMKRSISANSLAMNGILARH